MAVTCRVDGHSWGNEHSLDVQQERGYYQLFLFNCYSSEHLQYSIFYNPPFQSQPYLNNLLL